MNKRKKWTDQEDLDLQMIVGSDNLDPKWDLISFKMEELGSTKNAKQCRERLTYKMDASIEPRNQQE